MRCPSCNSTTIQRDFGDVYICSSCGNKFNVANTTQQKMPLVYLLLGVLLIGGILGYLKLSFPTFDKTIAINDYLKDYQQKNNKEIATTTGNQQYKIIYATNTETWYAKTQDRQTKITIVNKSGTEQVVAVLPSDNVQIAKENTALLLMYENTLAVLPFQSKKINCISCAINDINATLMSSVYSVDYIHYLNAFKILTNDYKEHYYLITTHQLISTIELEQLRKAELINAEWHFETVYCVVNNLLYKIDKRHQKYTMPISSHDVREILEGATWIKQIYQVVSVKQQKNIVLKYEDTEVLAQEKGYLILKHKNNSITLVRLPQQTTTISLTNFAMNQLQCSIEQDYITFYDDSHVVHYQISEQKLIQNRL